MAPATPAYRALATHGDAGSACPSCRRFCGVRIREFRLPLAIRQLGLRSGSIQRPLGCCGRPGWCRQRGRREPSRPDRDRREPVFRAGDRRDSGHHHGHANAAGYESNQVAARTKRSTAGLGSENGECDLPVIRPSALRDRESGLLLPRRRQSPVEKPALPF